MPLLLALLLLMTCAGSGHAEHLVITADGDEIPVTIHAADGERLLVWLSSEFGGTPRRSALAEALAAKGVEVWTPDLHTAWFLPTGRYSLNNVDPAAVSAIFTDAVGSGKRVFLMAEGRSVALALNSVRQWQLESDATGSLAGLLAISPRLYLRTPQGAEAAEYLPIASASNLPIYILQPEESGGFWRMAQDIRELEKGGSMVFAHRLPGVSDGFHARPEFSDAEAAMTRRLPAMLLSAMEQLEPYGGTPSVPAPMAGDSPVAPERPDATTLLRPYPGQGAAPALRLPELLGGRVDLADLKGKVVLVNFWATWCPPCVEEIPSLQKIYRRLQPLGLEILAVDVGESVETMQKFLADKPIDFPVLMDVEGEALRHWRIYAFPTTLVLDREHRIRYAVFGAFDWSNQEVIDALSPLLSTGELDP